MEYYNPIDHSSKRYAAVITIVVMAIVAFVVSYITIDVVPHHSEELVVAIEYLEPEEVAPEPKTQPQPQPVEQPKTATPQPKPQQAHENEAKVNTSNQTSGKEAQTQTVNQMALFKPTAGTTPDEEVVHGNRLAPEGENDSHQGEGTGLNTIGDVEFDGGLKGRGVVAGYPRPSGNNAVGKVVVSVVVNSEGRVESATVRGQGTTTTDPTLRANAVNAARKTKFKPDSLRMTQTGTITYKYIVN